MSRIALIIGKRGSGKTYFVRRRLLPRVRPFIVVDTVGEYTEGVLYDELDGLIGDAHTGRLTSAVYRPCFTDDVERFLLFAYHLSPFTLVVEEIHLYCNPRYISRGLDRLIRLGRHRGINLVGISQRALDFPQILASQVDSLVLFQQRGVRDIEYLERFTGRDLSSVRSLDRGRYIHIAL